MSVDMSQFHEVFFEESFEGLDDMESGLLELNVGEPDNETINTIFRAAHSIKGGSGTFGFVEIANFTHVMETLMDEMRAGQRMVSQEAIELLLQSVDVLRGMLEATRDSDDLDIETINKLQSELEKVLSGDAGSATEQSQADENSINAEESQSIEGWSIQFAPFENIFMTGNDPFRLINELDELGELEVVVNDEKLPSFEMFDYESCYLSWNITLHANVTEEQVVEIFDWVDDDCELEIKPIVNEAAVESRPSEKDEGAGDDATVSTESKTEPVQQAQEQGKPQAKKEKKASSESTSIRVGIDKIDTLINMVGELVITQSMLSQFGEGVSFTQDNMEKLKDGLALLERNTRELQENVLQIRMLPISFSFNRFPRLVRDLSNKLNKKIELKLSGEHTELDKTVMEKIGDPLVHLVRNSLDHGIEMPEDRVKAGKSETGLLHLNAYHEGGNIVIEINDDGAGLNKERILSKARQNGLVGKNEVLSDDKVNELIFMPGFSTAQEVSDVSGRGVGMDVVKRNIKDLGGVVEVESEEGKGSTFRIRLPLTLAILDGQLVKVSNQIYIIPLVSIIESLQIQKQFLNTLPGKGEVYRVREDYIPIIRLHDVFNLNNHDRDLDNGLLVVVESEGHKAGIFVDDLLAQQQFVIKSLETNYKSVDGISGATILGDGTVAMILDVSGTLHLNRKSNSSPKLFQTDYKAA